MRCSDTRTYIRYVCALGFAASGLMGCTSTGPRSAMDPQGLRWRSPGDPIATGRPPAITFDPYQPDGVPRPQGLARYFPGPTVVSPATNPMGAPMDRSTATHSTMLATRGEHRARPVVSAPIAIADAEEPEVSVLPIGITLETYAIPEGSADPQARLASRREPAETAGATPTPGAFQFSPGRVAAGKLVAGPTEVPNLPRSQMRPSTKAVSISVIEAQPRPRLFRKARAWFRRGS